MTAKTSVIGFPRIGHGRELKYSSENFFAGKISSAELESTAAGIRSYGWKKQSQAGINFIPSNDFSFYDNMLDTAVMLGAVPTRYSSLELSALDTYFAMARGYQGEKGDVKALAMKKWFNTNYHYLVPELDDDAQIVCKAQESKPVAEYMESKALGYSTVPALIGPYTFLYLAKYLGKKCREDFASAIGNAYIEIIQELSKNGAEWISLAEPALVFDTNESDSKLLNNLYRKILNFIHQTTKSHILLQTYFGDIRDSYNSIKELGFDGIGLDFIEGKKTLELISKGFPEKTLLFAGIVCGKNIWRTDYKKAEDLLQRIQKYVNPEQIVIGTSCSLLHVPYTTANETKLGKDILTHFAFAEEKLEELESIASNAKNKEIFATERVAADNSVKEAIQNLSAADFERKPAFAIREQIQKEEFNLPLFPTTTIGSFPQTKDVRENRAAFKKGKISKEAYEKFNQQKIEECIHLQEELGLDVLVHGEFERNDMVEYFGDHLSGFVFTENAWVQSYGTRCVKPPVIWGDISRREPITIKWSKFAQSCTKKPIKGMLTGPVTILNWSFPREDISLKEQVLQIGLAIRAEVLDLERNGIRIIQIDEAALREKLPLRKSDWHIEYLDWAIPAFRLVHSGVKPTTQIHTHMCYSEFTDIIPDIDNMDADVITFEASRSDLKILSALKKANFKTEVGPGVYDIHSPRVPSTEEITQALKKMLTKIPKEKLWVNPDCGLKTRGEAETKASLSNLVSAAKILRKEF